MEFKGIKSDDELKTGGSRGLQRRRVKSEDILV